MITAGGMLLVRKLLKKSMNYQTQLRNKNEIMKISRKTWLLIMLYDSYTFLIKLTKIFNRRMDQRTRTL